MSILIKSAKIVDAKSKFNGKTQDILIDKGKIQDISSNISDSKGKEKILKSFCKFYEPLEKIRARFWGEKFLEELRTGLQPGESTLFWAARTVAR